MRIHWLKRLTTKQRRMVNEELRSLGQADVADGIEEYLATNEYMTSDFSGSSGAISGLLSGISIIVGIWFVDAISLGPKIYVVAFAGMIVSVSLIAMYKHGVHDATRLATVAIIQERASRHEGSGAGRSSLDSMNWFMTATAATASAALTYLIVGRRRAK